jgi:hypothetical protein
MFYEAPGSVLDPEILRDKHMHSGTRFAAFDSNAAFKMVMELHLGNIKPHSAFRPAGMTVQSGLARTTPGSVSFIGLKSSRSI